MPRRKISITYVKHNGLVAPDCQFILGHEFSVMYREMIFPNWRFRGEEFIINKCREAASLVKGPTIIEDFYLSFNREDLPGGISISSNFGSPNLPLFHFYVYRGRKYNTNLNIVSFRSGAQSKWYMDELNAEGWLKLFKFYTNLTVVAVSVFCYCSSEYALEAKIFQGFMTGKFIRPDGEVTSWEQCFRPLRRQVVYADLDEDAKLFISPQHSALEKVGLYITKG